MVAARTRGLIVAGVAAAASFAAAGAVGLAGHLITLPGTSSQQQGETILPQGAAGPSLVWTSPTPGAGSAPGAPGSAAPRECPAEVRQALPSAATLVVGYETATFRVYICRLDTGELAYHGVSKLDTSQSITLPAVAGGDGFVATSSGGTGQYTYEITSRHLVVRHNGIVLRDEPVLGRL